MEPRGATPRIFISYSHADEAWKDRVVNQLGVLEHEGLLSVWEDRQITGGDDWLPAIETAIQSCGVAVLLISAKFLTSKFILGAEVPALLQRREKEGVRVIPVILKPCAWTRVGWLKSIQARPKDGKPLSGMTKHNAEAALSALAEEVADLLARSPRTTTTHTGVESESLERIRRCMLISASSRELRRCMYELESHLARYPHSAEGKELNDQLQIALRRAEAYECSLATSKPSGPRSLALLRHQLWGQLLIMLVLVVGGAGMYMWKVWSEKASVSNSSLSKGWAMLGQFQGNKWQDVTLDFDINPNNPLPVSGVHSTVRSDSGVIVRDKSLKAEGKISPGCTLQKGSVVLIKRINELTESDRYEAYIEFNKKECHQ